MLAAAAGAQAHHSLSFIAQISPFLRLSDTTNTFARCRCRRLRRSLIANPLRKSMCLLWFVCAIWSARKFASPKSWKQRANNKMCYHLHHYQRVNRVFGWNTFILLDVTTKANVDPMRRGPGSLPQGIYVYIELCSEIRWCVKREMCCRH